MRTAGPPTMTRPMGGAHYPVASYGFSQEFGDYLRNLPLEPGRGTIVGRTLLEVVPFRSPTSWAIQSIR